MINRTPKRKTKIVATLGPASNDRETIRQLLRTGVNVVRLNFSHGTHDQHTAVLNLVREEAAEAGLHIAVFQDLCGPKIRITELENGEINLEDNQTIRLRHGKREKGNSEVLYVDAFDPAKVVRPGE
ncbi:MAG: hypothetical protein KDD44_02525, partial [Bdellovibrionales bacterium]|nr:hypothetical protein [Bdellovibrionales bacterium]